MKILRKKNMKNIIEMVAQQKGVSVEEVRQEMKLAIEEARNNPDLEKQANFKKLFGNNIPTPEEFISTMAKQAVK